VGNQLGLLCGKVFAWPRIFFSTLIERFVPEVVGTCSAYFYCYFKGRTTLPRWVLALVTLGVFWLCREL
jgi:hypothetical protein